MQRPDTPNFANPQHFGLYLKIALGIGVLLLLSTAYYSVPAESEAIKLRFGRIVQEGIRPGLHFKIPFGIEQVDVKPVLRQLKLEFGYATPGASNPRQYGESDEQELVASMVTGDLNAVHVEWVIQYRITNLKDYLYRAREPEATLRDSAESVMREVVGDRTVDETITVGRLDMEAECKKKLQALTQVYSLGLGIELVQLKGVNPPQSVRASFDSVNQAKQEREKSINVALGERNKVIPKAKGEALQLVAEAKGEALKRVNEAKGDADRFTAVFKAYQEAPDITRRRLYLETMGKVLPLVGKKVILDSSASNVLPFLPLGENSGVSTTPKAVVPLRR